MTRIFFQNALVMNHTGKIADSLRIERDKITALDDAPSRQDVIVDLEGRIILPGLINAHDHLAMNNFGKLKYRQVYANANDWSLDIEARFNTDPAITIPRRLPISDRLFHSAIRNLLAGVTTVCHHDPWNHSLDARDYPVRVVKKFGYCHSLQRGGDVARSYQRTPRAAPWIIHLAEGTDDASAHELDMLDDLGCLQENTVLVHGVGMTNEQRRKVVERAGGLIWCPSSNLFLLGKTAEICELKRVGKIALGTDSMLTSSGNLWDEFRAAGATQQATQSELIRFVTHNPAQILRLENLGEIAMGAQADFTILPAPHRDPFADLLEITRSDMQLVMIGGKPRYGDIALNEIFAQAHTGAENIRVDGKEKVIANSIARRIKCSSIKEEGVEF